MEHMQQHFSGFIILLLLGLRHGLDPDHITIIDGYTYRLHQKGSLWTKWVGTLFALGHGVMVTLIAFVLSLLKNHFEVPEYLNFIIDWVPMLFLLTIGVLNIIQFTQKNEIKNTSFKKWMLPEKFNHHVNPISIVLTGIIFGFIFDTSTQIAAFGLAISASDQWLYSILGGIVFSMGLMLTGTFDSFYLSKLLKTFDQKKIKQHRFKLNILITLMCFIIPIYKISCYFRADLELDDFQNNLAGVAFILIILGIYTELYFRNKFKSRKIFNSNLPS